MKQLHCEAVLPRLHTVGAALFVIAALCETAHGQATADFYRGKQIVMLIGSGAGGGYDVYARTFARHYPRHIPGNPAVVAKNVPGAGGLTAANTLFNTPDREGLTIAALANTAGFDPLLGIAAARFDAIKFNWLGSIGKVSNVCATWHTQPVKTIEQAKTTEVVVAGAGAGTNSVVAPHILNTLLGTKFKVIGGYEPGTGLALAVENGETQGVCGLSWSTMKTARPDWIVNKRLNVILQMSLYNLADLPGVPSALDLVTDPADKAVLEFVLLRQETGRPFAASPGVPEDRVATLRKAFDATMTDPEFLADAERTQLEVDPLSGAQIDQLLAKAYAAPKDIIARAAILIEPSAAPRQ